MDQVTSLFSGKCIHEIVSARAKRSPDRIAITYKGRQVTYAELNARSNQLARVLRAAGVGPNVLVGLFLERDPDLLVGVLGILKAGGAYLPIDSAYPAERIAFILGDAGISVIVTQSVWRDRYALAAPHIVCLDADRGQIAAQESSDVETISTPDDLAYVIYTSGSTGNPKGSLITHRNVTRLFESTEAWFGFDETDVWTLFHSIAFDFSVWEIWGALFYGGKIAIVPFDLSRDPDAFYQMLSRERVTVLNQTPSAFRQLIRAEERLKAESGLALRYIVFGGEALDMKTLQPWFKRHGDHTPRLVNMYGITETTVHVTYRPLSMSDLDQPSMIGIPIPDLKIYILDENLRPITRGLTGEICVAGAGLGRGYLNRPELTASKFVTARLDSEDRRIYRSGDLGRFHTNGDLEYLGRMDHQVKIRGFRIETGEIEAVLNLHPAVRESVVLARDDERSERRLVGYIILQAHATAAPSELRSRLRERMPEYMIPSVFVYINDLPLTTNGKLDVSALPNPTADSVPNSAGPLPTPDTPLQQRLVEIWSEILGHTVRGVDDNFFDVGGNSLHVAEVHTRLRAHLGREIPITHLFTYTTIRSLAAHLEAKPPTKEVQDAVQDRARRQREAVASRKPVRRPP